MERELAKAKVNYENKIEKHFSGSNITTAWQGLKSMASINKRVGESKQHISINGVLDVDISNTLNSYFSRFERCDLNNIVSALRDSLVAQNDLIICKDLM